MKQKGSYSRMNTVNVDIFASIHFRGFMKMGNFACIKIRVFSTNDSLDYNDGNFHRVYVYSWIFKKSELSENIYSANISTFTVIHISSKKNKKKTCQVKRCITDQSVYFRGILVCSEHDHAVVTCALVWQKHLR